MIRSICSHKDLDVWQLSMDMTVSIYRVAARLPDSEKFGLTTQLRRAAVSVPSNIAEGAARGSSAEFARYLMIARGSVAEIETQLVLVERLDLCPVDEGALNQVIRVRQMLTALIRKLVK